MLNPYLLPQAGAASGLRPACQRTAGSARSLLALLVMLTSLSTGIARAASVPVVVDVSKRQAVTEEVPVTGTVTSPRVARLSPEVAGLVSEVLVDAGARVDAGAALVRFDDTLAALAVAAAEAASTGAREELADARRRLKDAERLVSSRGIAETEVEARRSEVRADVANLNLRDAELRREQERLRRHVIKAPFPGVISRKLTEAGEWVAPGDQVLELIADRGLRIDFQVPQAYYPRIDSRTRMELRLDAIPNRRLDAVIGEVVPVSDPNARSFLMRVYPGEDGLPLTPGMSASGLLRLATGSDAVVVSRDALLRHPDGRITLWVLEPDGESVTVSERLVKTGLAFDGRVVVTEGLEAGVRVVVEGNEALRPNQPVTIREAR